MRLRPVDQPELAECDPTKVLENFEDCPEILGPVAKLFREAYVPDMQALRRALENRDSVNFAFIAHKIKGSASYFRADHVTHIAGQLEERGQRKDLNGVHTMVEELNRALNSLSRALKQAEERLEVRL
jgi:HPt (histidine-containing phosphotransfer) domain-containing protein